MAFLTLTAAFLLLPATLAQTEKQQITWSTTSFVYHGEKTPSLSPSPYDLTPIGAQQLYAAGSLHRSTYISPHINATYSAVINGISAETIDNTQLYVLAADDSYVTASAMAFLQGLYPPVQMMDEENELQNGSWISSPLGGYQYPNIASVSSLDYNFIWTAGNQECTEWSIAEVFQLGSTEFTSQYSDTLEFYQSLAQPMFGALDYSIVNFDNAYALWEYASYQSIHNTTFQTPSLLSVSDLPTLFNLASEQQWAYLTPQVNSTVQSVAGATLASKVLQQFEHNIASAGIADKMTLLFGTFEPMLSFFSLSSLSEGPSASRFNSLPMHGSILTFELFSYASSSAIENFLVPYPDSSDLYVRFLFRNGTDESEDLVSYPLFHRGNSEADMSWSDFVDGMAEFSLDDVSDWCAACQTATLFCEAIADDLQTSTPSSSKSSGGIAPTIAGVIGATVTIAVCLLVGALLMLIGFRVEFVPRKDRKGEAATGAAVLGGGFKGREKLASDTDLTLKGGAGIRHERVGSWELNDAKKDESLDKEIEAGRVVSGADYGRHSEEIDVGRPVKPFESV